MTRRERTNSRSLAFSGWIRRNLNDSFNGLVVQDIDWIFVNYFSGYFILVEEKTNLHKSSAYTPPAQTVILKMINDLLELASETNQSNGKVYNPASKKLYCFKGSFILEFIGGTDPDNSREIYLNKFKISKEELIILLNLEEDSLDLLQKYKSNWIDENLDAQIHILKSSR